jgi:hypothetical protein
MAYIIGLATQEEITELKKRGWDIGVPPKEIDTAENDEGEPNPLTSIQIWVDSNVMDIMDGADWEGSPLNAELREKLDEIDALSAQYKLDDVDFKNLVRRVCGLAPVEPCVGRPTACSEDCPGWAWFNSDKHGFEVEQCNECARFEGDLEAELHILDCDSCRVESRKQLMKIIEELNKKGRS